MKVSRILSTKGADVITIRPNRSVKEAILLLTEHNIGALVVTDTAERLVGIISERDIVRHAAVDEDLLARPLSDIMTRNVIVGVPQDELSSIAHTMTERRFRHVPIVVDDRLVGIVSIGDVLKAQRDAYRGEIDTLETQILADEK